MASGVASLDHDRGCSVHAPERICHVIDIGILGNRTGLAHAVALCRTSAWKDHT